MGKRPSQGKRHTGREKRERERLRQEVEPPLGEELLSYRFENGLDLWTGKPLTGKRRAEWERLQQEVIRQEEEAERRKALGMIEWLKQFMEGNDV